MFVLTFFAKFFKALRSGQSPAQVSAGFSFGYLIGLTPFFSLQTIMLFLLLIFLDINLAAGGVAILVASLFAWLLDPIIHNIGYFVLVDIPFLHGLWESLYNMPFAPLTKFYNTVAIGSLLFGLITVWPVYWLMKKLVIKYRERIEMRLKKLKIVQTLRGSFVFKWYDKIRKMVDIS